MRRLVSPKTFLGVIAATVVLMWSAAVSAQDAPTDPDHEFTIAVGETLTFDASGVRRIAAGDDSVADPQTSDDGRHLFVTGRSPGISTVNIFSGRGDEQRTILVRVVGVNPTSLAEEVRDVLGEGAGVDIRVVNGRVLIEGEVSSEVFQKKIDRLTELYPDQVLNFATYREAFVEGARMVAMDVYFIQLAATQEDDLGVRWNQFIGGNYTGGTGDVPLYYEEGELSPGVLPGEGSEPPRPMALTGGDGLTTYSSLVGNLNFALDFLVEQGMVKTIQQGTLVTEAGTETEYVSGGTLLFEVSGVQEVGIEQIPFGLQVNILPIMDFENHVKLEIDVSYDEVDFALGIGDMPGLRGTEVQSTVNMQEGQSVLISAQESMDNQTTEQGFWLLKDIPILGWLFKSRTHFSEELNNALFITPRVYEPGTDHHRTMVQGVFQGLMDSGADAEALPKLEDAELDD